MFIEPTITWVPSGFTGYIWLDTKIVLKKSYLLRDSKHGGKIIKQMFENSFKST